MATLQSNHVYSMGDRYGQHPDDEEFPGTLIIVEGIDGSGKSTQIDLLQKWLRSRNLVTVYTEWNSSPIVKRTTKQAKNKELLTPMSFSLIHAADFASRVHAQILPALRAGAIVLADRYVRTPTWRGGGGSWPSGRKGNLLTKFPFRIRPPHAHTTHHGVFTSQAPG